MDRRDFIKLATSAAALSGPMLRSGLLKAATVPDTLSLAILTDKPDIAIAASQRLLNSSDLQHDGPLAFHEAILPGVQTGDVVLVRNNTLVDFRRANDGFSQQVRKIAGELGLPREMENPVLLRFATKGHRQQAKTISVYHGQSLIKQYNIRDRFSAERIEGTNGPVVLSLQHGHIRVTAASCKHKTCMNMGSIHKPGQNLVCIPNELRVAIAGENELGVDGVVF